MYWPDIGELKEFYGTALGRIVCRKLRARIRACWPELQESRSASPVTVCGVGFATPYLIPFLTPSGSAAPLLPVAVMPAAQGAGVWPGQGRNLALLSQETALPLPDASAQYALLVHALEYTEHPLALLREIWRILTPQGKLLVIVPNRRSIWARVESTPFGHGHPFTPRQLGALLEDAMFAQTRLDTALFLPPVRSRTVLRMAEFLGKAGRVFFGPLGGALLIEAEKRIYATTREPVRVRRMIFSAAGSHGRPSGIGAGRGAGRSGIVFPAPKKNPL